MVTKAKERREVQAAAERINDRLAEDGGSGTLEDSEGNVLAKFNGNKTEVNEKEVAKTLSRLKHLGQVETAGTTIPLVLEALKIRLPEGRVVWLVDDFNMQLARIAADAGARLETLGKWTAKASVTIERKLIKEPGQKGEGSLETFVYFDTNFGVPKIGSPVLTALRDPDSGDIALPIQDEMDLDA